jgi:hypothetical protein
MRIGKGLAMTAALIGAVALGVAIGPSITRRDANVTPAPAITASAPAETSRPRPAAAPRAKMEAKAETEARENMVAISASAPQLHERLKSVLNRGTRMELAAEGFRDAEQFATVAHAARNTDVPFVVLKHRVLNEGQSLADAIRVSKPELDAKREVSRARNAARFDLELIAG